MPRRRASGDDHGDSSPTRRPGGHQYFHRRLIIMVGGGYRQPPGARHGPLRRTRRRGSDQTAEGGDRRNNGDLVSDDARMGRAAIASARWREVGTRRIRPFHPMRLTDMRSAGPGSASRDVPYSDHPIEILCSRRRPAPCIRPPVVGSGLTVSSSAGGHLALALARWRQEGPRCRSTRSPLRPRTPMARTGTVAPHVDKLDQPAPLEVDHRNDL